MIFGGNWRNCGGIFAKAACKSAIVIFSPLTIASNVFGLKVFEGEEFFPAETVELVENILAA